MEAIAMSPTKALAVALAMAITAPTVFDAAEAVQMAHSIIDKRGLTAAEVEEAKALALAMVGLPPEE